MIKELRAHGPLAVGMLPGNALRGYNGGIIQDSDDTALIEEEEVNHYSMLDYRK